MRKRKNSRKAQESEAESGPTVSTPAISQASKRYLQSSISPVEGSIPPYKSVTSYWETEDERDTDSQDRFTSDENPELVREAPALSEDVRPMGRAYALDDDFPHFEEEKTPAPPSASPPPPKAGPSPASSPSSSLPETESQPTLSPTPESDPEPSWFTEQIAAIEDEMKRREEAGPQHEAEPEPESSRPIPVPPNRGYNRFSSPFLQESRKYQRLRYGPEPMEHRVWRQFPLLKRTPEEEERRRKIFASPFVSEHIGFGVFFGLRRHPCFEETSGSEDNDEVGMEREAAESSDEETENLALRRSKRVRFRR